MGYSTHFSGKFSLDKPLTLAQYNELNDFSEKDHRHDAGMPGYHCDWVPTKDGEHIEHNNRENFYDYIEWLEYLIEHFFKPWGITVNGEVTWQGEEVGDLGVITAKNNVVTSKKYGEDDEEAMNQEKRSMTPQQEQLVLAILTKLADVQPVIDPYYEDHPVYQCIFCGKNDNLMSSIAHTEDCVVALAKQLKEM